MSAAFIEAKLDGLKETLALLDDIKRGVRNRIMRKALRAGARPIIKAARSLVPQRTRQMKKALGVIIRTYTSGVVAAILGVRKGFKVEIDGRWVNPEKYLHLVLFGRGEVVAGMAKGQPTGKRVLSDEEVIYGRHVAAVPGNNFLAAAFEQGKSAALEAIAETVRTELAKYRK